MNKIMKIIPLILLILILTSCASARDDATPDAIPFNLLDEIEISETEKATIYEISDIENVYYVYEQFTKPDSTTWIINYIYSYEYIVDDENIPIFLYDHLYDTVTASLDRIQEEFNIEFKYNKDGFSEEREVVIDDIKEEDEVFLIDLYIPYKITYQDGMNKNDYVVMIPVYTFLSLKNGDNISFNNETYNFVSFTEKSNVLKK